MSDEQEDNVIQFSKSSLKDMLAENAANIVAERVTTNPADDQKLLDRLNNKHAFVRSHGGSPKIMSTIKDHFGRDKKEYTTLDAFTNPYCNETTFIPSATGKTFSTIEVGKWWIKHADRREYAGVCYNPNDNSKDKYGQRISGPNINTWIGFSCEPKQGTWKLTKKHIWKILSNKNKEKFKYLMRWLAWTFQNPGTRAEVAIIFKGRKGAGKGFIANTVNNIFGEHGQYISNRKHLTGQFTGHLADKSFLFADEAYYPGDKEVEGTLKALITEPNMVVEPKGVQAYTIPNTLHIMMCTNNDWVISADSSERRFYINEVDPMYSKDGDLGKFRGNYFRKLFIEVEKGGREAMLYDMLNMDLKGWHPRDDVPQTIELQKQAFFSLNYGARTIYEFLNEGVFPGSNQLQVDGKTLQGYLENIYPDAKKASTNAKSEALRKIGASKKRLSKGIFWQFLSLEDARLLYIQEYGEPLEPFKVETNELEVWKFTKPDF